MRVEAFSDAVIAIIITLLVIELHVPHLEDFAGKHMFAVLRESGLLLQLGCFAFSFFSLSVFWVNHHHFFHELERSDWRLIWHNNHLLLWLALIPFYNGVFGCVSASTRSSRVLWICTFYGSTGIYADVPPCNLRCKPTARSHYRRAERYALQTWMDRCVRVCCSYIIGICVCASVICSADFCASLLHSAKFDARS